ncbi:MAG: hypothetical protein QM647_17070 [Asticcacaulis sp.]|uniref:hypothetical protein n=1 Tax=Asticcacaulis sp. TaxID=1872648 RepID=UPI0039E51479
MFLALLAAAAFQSAAYIGPLAPAGSGMAQCYDPDQIRKVCASMATYHQNADGSFTSKSLILISKAPVAILEMNTRVAIRNGAVCGTIQESDITASRLTVSDTAVAPEQAAPVLAQISQGMAGVVGHEICTSYMKSGPDMVAKATIDGVPKPDQDQVVLWVSPSEGYTVAP